MADLPPMNYSTIRDDFEVHPSANFSLLREKAIRYVQEASGKLWTDYNIHDPGVTLLEAFCYAITDVAYRISMDIEDLLLHASSANGVFKSHMLLPAEQVFTPRACTVQDYRTLILDQFFDEIAQVYITALDRDPNGIRGLFSIEIVPTYDLSPEQRAQLIHRVRKLWVEHRSVGEDIHRINVLKPLNIAFDARIVISDQVDVHEVLAELLFAVRSLIQPTIEFRSFQQLKEAGLNEAEIFSIPSFKNGFINPASLLPKRNVYQKSQFRQLFARTKGVKELYDFHLTLDGVLQREEWLKVPEDAFLNIKMDDITDWGLWHLDLIQFGKLVQVDLNRAQSIYQKLIQQERAKNIHLFRNSNLPKASQVTTADITGFKSIAYDLPGIYRVGNFIPAEKEPISVKVSSRQLTQYISFFDELLKDYLSLLAEIESLYSIDKPINSEQRQSFFEELRSKLLQHLLARYGEYWYLSNQEHGVNEQGFDFKQQFLHFLRDQGALSTASFRYLGVDENAEIFPIKTRIDLKAGFLKQGLTSLVLEDSLLDEVIESDDENLELNEGEISISCPEDNPEAFLLRYASEKDRYSIQKQKTSDKNTFHLQFDSPIDREPQIVAKANDKASLEILTNKIIARLEEINHTSDGFHLVEHILLRPRHRQKAQFYLTDEHGDQFQSLDDAEPLLQYNNARDTALLASYSNNYKVIHTEDDEYRVLIKDLTGKGRAKSIHKFMTQIAAEDYVQKQRGYFEQLKKDDRLNEAIRIQTPKVFNLFILDKVGEIVFQTKEPSGFEELQQLQQWLVEGLKIGEHFEVVQNGEEKFSVLINAPSIVFESTSMYENEDQALFFIEEIKRIFRGLRLVTDAAIFFRVESINAGKADDYSYKASLVIPDWTKRFQQETEVAQLLQIARSELPAYLSLNVLRLSKSEMLSFEENYFEWVEKLKESELDESIYESLNLLSGRLLTILNSKED